MKYHLIAIGGSAMHNLALALHQNNHTITGSDDEVYNPSRERLLKKGLLPDKMGWYPERITSDLDAVILGMHARIDNPELAKAKELGIPIFSYPEFIYEHSKHKKRVVIAGSHGKTTTTSMIMYALSALKVDFDYLVGAQIEGFENMVRLSNATVMIIEGDEYLSSPIDRRPKMWLYHAHFAIITGVAWDHMNVFPTFQSYKHAFTEFVNTMEKDGVLIGFGEDKIIQQLLQQRSDIRSIKYEAFDYKNGSVLYKNTSYPVSIFGKHNLQNLKAASLVCNELGVSIEKFLVAIEHFKGAAKRLQKLYESDRTVLYKDFAHAPSKVKATINAIRSQYPDKKIIALVELHTFSSLSKEFLPEYNGSTNEADITVVYFDEHTIKMKKMPPLEKHFIQECFNNEHLMVVNGKDELLKELDRLEKKNVVLLFMSSGNFGGMDLENTSYLDIE